MRLVFTFLLVLSTSTWATSDTDMRQRLEYLYGESAPYEAFFVRLKGAIKSGDAQTIAALNSYPLKISTQSGELIVRSAKEFVDNETRIITDSVQAAAAKQTFAGLFAKDDGLMIGGGEIWFSGICVGKRPGRECEDIEVKVISYNSAINKVNPTVENEKLVGTWRSQHEPYQISFSYDGTFEEILPAGAHGPGSPSEVLSTGLWRESEQGISLVEHSFEGSARALIDNPDSLDSADVQSPQELSTVNWIDDDLIYLGDLDQAIDVEGYDSAIAFGKEFGLYRVAQ